MNTSWWPWLFMVLGIACIPWLVRKAQQHGALPRRPGGHTQVLSACPVGPQQQVVTVKIACGERSAVLVLGVTPSSVHCLHRWEDSAAVALGGDAVVATAVAPPEGAV
ncbi:MAG: flagellar biosynthetic protein FliO [Rhodoferax sp.]